MKHIVTNLFLLCGLIIGLLPSANAADKPNIIYIMADDLGYGDLSFMGQKHFETKFIDQMRAEGMSFTQYYAGSTVCAPSRSCIMTGQHTGHTTVRGNSSNVGERGGRVGLEVGDITIAEVLKAEGYRTGLVGKWGIGEEGSEVTPNKKGFDFFYGFLNQRNAHNYYPPFLWRNDEKVMFPENDTDGMTGQFAHDLMTEEALQFVDRNADNPFFLYLAYTIPHAEMTAPEDAMIAFLGKFPEDKTHTKRGGSYGTQANPKAAFAAMMTRLDRDVGRLIRKLKDKGIDENTLVIFTSDNGPHGEGGHDYEFFDSNGPLKGFKRDLYEGGIRVPFIVRWPGKIEANSTSDHIGAFWDFFPTALDLAGAESAADVDGISILPTLLGQPKKQKEHELLYWEFFEQGGRQAIRMGDWKAIRYDVNRDHQSTLELYDLSKDLGEENNIAADNPKLVKKLDQAMQSARTESEYFKFRHEME
jgi:arylsulfatase A